MPHMRETLQNVVSCLPAISGWSGVSDGNADEGDGFDSSGLMRELQRIMLNLPQQASIKVI